MAEKAARSNWGEFGPDDQIGRLNLLTPETVLAAVGEVREGRVFCLSLPLDRPGGRILTPHRFPPRLTSIVRKAQRYFHYQYGRENPDWHDVVSDDSVHLSNQYSTHWDGLAHVGQMFDIGDSVEKPVYYNGYRAGDIRNPEDRSGADETPLGIDRAARTGMQGRGVLVNLARRFGSDRALIDGA